MSILEAAKGVLQFSDIILIVTGIVMGTLARIKILEVDYRQNPTYPNGYLITIITGFVAASLGSVAIPALLSKNFTAVTFLTVAIQQFREIRKIERESLEKLEPTQQAQRGAAYIDGISKTYEARNYIAFLVSFGTVLIMKIANLKPIPNIILGAVTGIIILILIESFTKGKTVGDLCDIKEGKIEVRGTELYVDNIYVTSNLGTARSRELYQNEGLAIVLEPKQEIFRVTLDNIGQRQAILFEVVRALGVKRFKFTRKEFKKGRIVITLVPIINDIERFKEVVMKTPILENSRKIHRIMDSHLIGGGKNG